MRILLSYCVLLGVVFYPVDASAQRLLEIGFKGGIPLNDAVKGAEDRSAPFAFGGMASLNLPLGFAIEGNALYKRIGYRLDLSGPMGGGVLDSRSGVWEFPVLLKSYPLGRNPLIQPFLSAGLNFRSVGLALPNEASERTRSSGLALAVGARNGLGRIKIAPEIRYTRWRDSLVLLPLPGTSTPRLNANQLEFLVGITF